MVISPPMRHFGPRKKKSVSQLSEEGACVHLYELKRRLGFVDLRTVVTDVDVS
jgi:hypothetical protein